MNSTIDYNLRLPPSLEPKIPDLPKDYTLIRVLKAGLPLVVLVPQIGQALQYVAGFANCYESAKNLIANPNDRLKNIAIVSFNISSLALLVVNPLAVSILLSGWDIFDESTQMGNKLIEGQYKEASWKALKVAEKSVYIASVIVGGPELVLISMLAQTAFEIYKFNQFRVNDMQLEAAVQVVVIGVRSYGIYSHISLYEDHFQKLYENIKTQIGIAISNYQQTSNSLNASSLMNVVNTKIEEINLKNSEIKASDLAKLVGLPFAWQESQSFRIDEKNSRGEAVGVAFFKNADPKIMSQEEIAWYWNPESKFKVIATQSELLKVYGKEGSKEPFGFYRLFINESGAVASSFLINHSTGHYNEYSWFWWSLNQGLNLNSSLPSHQTVQGINDQGFVLIERNSSLDFTLILKNIYDQENSQTFDFRPYSEFPAKFAEDLKEMLRKSNYYGPSTKLSASFHWYPFSVDQFDNDLKISGHGTCTVKFKHLKVDIWMIQIGYKIENGKAVFFIEKITDQVHPYGTPIPINKKIIYEKNLINEMT